MQEIKTRDEIITDIYNDPKVFKMIFNIVPKDEAEDFIGVFLEQLCLVKEEKLIQAYENNYLQFFLSRLITNQYRSKSSVYYRLFKKNRMSGILNKDNYLSKDISDINKKNNRDEDNPFITQTKYDIINELDGIISNPLKYSTKDYKEEDNMFVEDEYLDVEERTQIELDEIKTYKQILFYIDELKWYSKEILTRYLIENKSLPEIAKETGIVYSSIWAAYTKGKKIIKRKIKKYNDNNTNNKDSSNVEIDPFSIFIDKTRTNS